MSFHLDIIAERRRKYAHEQRAAEAEAHADAMLKTAAYNPLLYLNFHEALTQCSAQQFNDLAALLEEKRFADAGRELLDITQGYWKRLALADIETAYPFEEIAQI